MINRYYRFILYIVTLIIISTYGFYFIESPEWSLLDSLYMTIITLTTVGFSEVHT
ncbi:MAG: ion channel, partial [Fidelibacterota bacterium]